MILDTLKNIDRYQELHPYFARAFDWLRDADFAALPDGNYQIEGDELFVILARSDGRDASPLEAHRRYIDIQFVVEGEDEIGWRSIGDCKQQRGAFDSGRDIVFFNDEPRFYAKLGIATFAILFPSDAHAPLSGTGATRKAVVKVSVY